MTERQLIAYAMLTLLAVAIAAMVWWGRYNSARRMLARKQAKQRKQSDARAMALMSATDAGDQP
jgi:hypothetical protein